MLGQNNWKKPLWAPDSTYTVTRYRRPLSVWPPSLESHFWQRQVAEHQGKKAQRS